MREALREDLYTVFFGGGSADQIEKYRSETKLHKRREGSTMGL